MDLRSHSNIELLPPYSMVRFGSGLTWNQVLNVVDPEKLTMIHKFFTLPQAMKESNNSPHRQRLKNVGVGGH